MKNPKLEKNENDFYIPTADCGFQRISITLALRKPRFTIKSRKNALFNIQHLTSL